MFYTISFIKYTTFKTASTDIKNQTVNIYKATATPNALKTDWYQ